MFCLFINSASETDQMIILTFHVCPYLLFTYWRFQVTKLLILIRFKTLLEKKSFAKSILLKYHIFLMIGLNYFDLAISSLAEHSLSLIFKLEWTWIIWFWRHGVIMWNFKSLKKYSKISNHIFTHTVHNFFDL